MYIDDIECEHITGEELLVEFAGSEIGIPTEEELRKLFGDTYEED